MTLINRFAKYSSSAALLLAFFLVTAPAALSQSTNEAVPTVIERFPVEGNLPAGTYYYQFRTGGGPATAVLDVTTPAGGASVSASFSGPDCCTAEAYVSAESGRADRFRQASEPFNVPSAQKLNVTVNISVAKGQTVRFKLNFSNPNAGSGITITPPSAQPGCTDLAIEYFMLNEADPFRKEIVGSIKNISPTAFKGTNGARRSQWVEVRDITDSGTEPPLVGRFLFTDVPARGTLHFNLVHTLRDRRRTRYEVSVLYAAFLPLDRITTNDDCNSSNNVTRRQLIAAPLDELQP